MTSRERTWFWIGFLVLLTIGVYVLRDVLLPFVAGMAVAYFLDPVVDRLERLKVSRGLGTFIVLAGFTLVIVGALLLLIPLIQAQVGRLSEVLPNYSQRLQVALEPLVAFVQKTIEDGDAKAKIPDVAGTVFSWVGGLASRVISGGLAVANLLSLFVITPIVSFYLLRDWDRIIEKIDGWLPRAKAEEIREQAGRIDETLAAFVRGQATVCIALGTFYAIGLSLAGLDFGLVIGLFAGLISFVPFVGTIVGGVLAVGLAIAQFSGWEMVVVVAAIFVAGQAIEGNFLTPNLVGDAVGLHPVWVIFALLAGGALFGFVGVLLAVPVAAVIGVLARFALSRYLSSPLHTHGFSTADDAKASPAEGSDEDRTA
jgi:predicted PurR-regulated permease PerM